MALKLTEKDLALTRASILALKSSDPQIQNMAMEQLKTWLSESPEHHTPHLLYQCSKGLSDQQKHVLGVLLGEVATLPTLPSLAHFGLQYSPSGNIARDAINYWAERASVSEVAQGLYICLDLSLTSIKSPLIDFTLGLLTERILKEPHAAFWPIIRKLKSPQARRYYGAVQTGRYLAELLPPVDLPRPSGGSLASPMTLPTPAQNTLDNAHELPAPSVARDSKAPSLWWRRWKR